MSDSAAQPDAGWYPHPSLPGVQRYWDGQAWTEHVATRRATPKRLRDRTWLVLLTIAAVLGTLFGTLWLISYESGENKAKRACKEYVKFELKAPSTADFSSDYAKSRSDGGGWTVSGIVDSDNSFGAKVRSVYTCNLTNDYVVTSSNID